MSEERKENIQTGNPLGEASVVSLMVKFAVPSIIAMLVSALYNIVDQLFIAMLQQKLPFRLPHPVLHLH